MPPSFLAISESENMFADGVRICFAGYGATTLPAVTEALTIEGNATLAEEEASRVVALLDKLTETIKV